MLKLLIFDENGEEIGYKYVLGYGEETDLRRILYNVDGNEVRVSASVGFGIGEDDEQRIVRYMDTLELL